MSGQPANIDEESVRAYFREVTLGKDPHRFQLRIITQLLQGEDVVALAPTGAGKTLAPVVAFAYAKRHGLDFADRLIYALPQRTLTIALRDVVAAILTRVEPNLRVTMQTGAMPEDPYFVEGDVIFTTIDQLLSAYIEVPVSLSDRLSNVPSGALLGSLIVFDEFHLLEPARSLATALDLARQLKPYSRTLLMSATFPSSALDEVVRRAEAVLVEVKPGEIAAIPSQRNKQRTYLWHSEPLSAEAVLHAHCDRTMVVVNRVERAQQLYEEIKRGAIERGKSARVLLLHSRFLQEDRHRHEREVIEHFKKDGLGKAILVATQVVEVGLDITCDTLHTEVATASALFQRAGRCARYENQTGTVHVYDLETTQSGRRYGPYRPDKNVVDALVAEMESRSGTIIAFGAEQEVVNLTHRDIDVDRLVEVSRGGRREQVVDAQRGHEPACVRQLIRQVDSINVLIHHDPISLDLARRPETFSLPRSVFHQLLGQLDLAGCDAGKVLYPDMGGDAEGYRLRPEWKPVTQSSEAQRHFILAIHPSLASYDGEYGLRLRPPTPGEYESRMTLAEPDTRVERYSYVKESFSEHAQRVLRETERLLATHRVAISRVASELDVSPSAVESLSRLVAVTHDLGKLSVGVQDAMWRWMQVVHGERRVGFLAHTRFNAEDPRQVDMQREERFRRPPHAVEGAFAARRIVNAMIGRLGLPPQVGKKAVAALFSAIARHHSPGATRVGSFVLCPGSAAETSRLLADFGIDVGDVRLEDSPSDAERAILPQLMVDPAQNSEAYAHYLLAVRLLRIADQRATARKEKP